MMTRAYALRRLAEQFPVESESQLGAEDRQLLHRLRDDHATALRQQVAGIERLLGPTLGAAEIPADLAPSSTEDLFQSARRVDKLMSVLFGSAPGETNVDQLPTQLMSALAQLRARVEAYNRTEK
jgi:hypothetical protein